MVLVCYSVQVSHAGLLQVLGIVFSGFDGLDKFKCLLE